MLGRRRFASSSPLTSAGPARGLHHRLGMTSQPRPISSGADGAGGSAGSGGRGGAGVCAEPLENGWGPAGALRAASGRPGRQQQEASLWPQVRLPQTGSGGEGWRGSQKQLYKYRFASFLSAQRMVRACLMHGELRQARDLHTTHFSVRSFASFFIHCITFPTDSTFK